MVAAALLLAALVTAIGATRQRAPDTKLPDPDDDVPNITIDDTGAVIFTNGTRWDPILASPLEPALPSDAIICHTGTIYGVRIPPKPGFRGSFYYLTHVDMPQYWPLQFYIESTNDSNQFLVLPPLDSTVREWYLVVDDPSYSLNETTGVSSQRVFPLGAEHPCGPQGDWEGPFLAAMAAKGQPRKRRSARALWELLHSEVVAEDPWP
mmetsp:Transcript_79961/g.232153  ORF Transcript_79961/g.232153 Transcript_79961/m.232153 type:complete len:208 (+) Transcript_79961:83-706(+)